MYKNYGDVNFYEHGILVDDEHSDTEFSILRCEPYSDEDDLFQFSELMVDITDDWINRKDVMESIGMTEETFDPVRFAIACTDYYNWDNFGAYGAFPQYDWRHMHKKDIHEILSYRLIDSSSVEW